jgi:hypothetical protein
MPNFRLPRGRNLMAPPDFAFDRMFAGQGQVTGGGNFPVVGLYNSSTVNEVAVVYGWSMRVTADTEVYFSYVRNPPRTSYTSADPLNPARAASAVAVYNSVVSTPATPTAGSWQATLGSHYWPYPWPCAVVPPGWGWQATAPTGAITLYLTIFWMITSLAGHTSG